MHDGTSRLHQAGEMSPSTCRTPPIYVAFILDSLFLYKVFVMCSHFSSIKQLRIKVFYPQISFAISFIPVFVIAKIEQTFFYLLGVNFETASNAISQMPDSWPASRKSGPSHSQLRGCIQRHLKLSAPGGYIILLASPWIFPGAVLKQNWSISLHSNCSHIAKQPRETLKLKPRDHRRPAKLVVPASQRNFFYPNLRHTSFARLIKS